MNIILLGPPGSGKGTLAKPIAEHFSMKHISTGDILRSRNQNHGDGKFASDETVIAIIKESMGDSNVFDGFPRTMLQAAALDHICEIDAVIYIDGELDMFLKRIVERGKTSGRMDDTEEVARRRMYEYAMNTEPLKNYYESRGILYPIDGKGTKESVLSNTVDILTNHTSNL